MKLSSYCGDQNLGPQLCVSQGPGRGIRLEILGLL